MKKRLGCAWGIPKGNHAPYERPAARRVLQRQAAGAHIRAPREEHHARRRGQIELLKGHPAVLAFLGEDQAGAAPPGQERRVHMTKVLPLGIIPAVARAVQDTAGLYVQLDRTGDERAVRHGDAAPAVRGAIVDRRLQGRRVQCPAVAGRAAGGNIAVQLSCVPCLLLKIFLKHCSMIGNKCKCRRFFIFHANCAFAPCRRGDCVL